MTMPNQSRPMARDKVLIGDAVLHRGTNDIFNYEGELTIFYEETFIDKQEVPPGAEPDSLSEIESMQIIYRKEHEEADIVKYEVTQISQKDIEISEISLEGHNRNMIDRAYLINAIESAGIDIDSVTQIDGFIDETTTIIHGES